ncbi:MAG: protein translocase subunit SecF [Nanohaloarchaea archaeon]|nr:protein translocase subunit SecF [Candidatus Nanohaloarchaea archaeon]
MEFEKYFDSIYEEYDKYLVVPVALIALSVLALGFSLVTTGEVVQKGLDFTGGTEATYSINESFTTGEIEQVFLDAGRSKVQVFKTTSGENTGLSVRVPPPKLKGQEAAEILNSAGYNVSVQSTRELSASVSDAFFTQAVLAFVMAFTIMSLVIFYAFKDLTPSAAVIFAAAGDIIFALAGMSILGIPLTLGSLAALLMLIGYSVDTDIVLSTRVLKQERNTVKDRIWDSMKTGVTMSSGGIAGFTLLYIVSQMIVGPSELSNIAAVMVIGLLADMPFTWFGNAIILKKYVDGEIPSINIEKVIPWR